ncbi:MAG: prepilin-type N-terminal cleavage/methylation domain-containing protein [Candidatus Harrisonbacteria bacterium]|nr:prepilin-type N-terminal cleavage/methylation domain-containing protein [Candidatus Harrisonbacteria bacterium]
MNRIRGQSLIEILIGVMIGAILVGGAAVTIAITLRSNLQNKNIQTASSLGQELLDKVTVFTEADWHNLYDVAKSPAQYYLGISGQGFSASSGSEIVTLDNKEFTRYFTVENVSRDAGGNIEAIYSPSNDDPSTQKVIVTITWNETEETAEVNLDKFLTRSRNLIYRQTDWSGGGGQEGPIISVNNLYSSSNLINDTEIPGSIKVTGF